MKTLIITLSLLIAVSVNAQDVERCSSSRVDIVPSIPVKSTLDQTGLHLSIRIRVRNYKGFLTNATYKFYAYSSPTSDYLIPRRIIHSGILSQVKTGIYQFNIPRSDLNIPVTQNYIQGFFRIADESCPSDFLTASFHVRRPLENL